MIDYMKIRSKAWDIQDNSLGISSECNSKVAWKKTIQDCLEKIENDVREIRRELNNE